MRAIQPCFTRAFQTGRAALQFIALSWAAAALGYKLGQATQLQGISATGIAIGAVIAARLIPLNRSLKVLPIGIAMGVAIIAMAFVRKVYMAMVLMMLIGAISGFFVVPMNALLQHRGHVLMGAGHSIAIQNFNENLSILVMLGFYAALIRIDISVYAVIVLLGVRRVHNGVDHPAAQAQCAQRKYPENSRRAALLTHYSTTGRSGSSSAFEPDAGKCIASSAVISRIPCNAPSS